MDIGPILWVREYAIGFQMANVTRNLCGARDHEPKAEYAPVWAAT
jgi:hypothetical protein